MEATLAAVAAIVFAGGVVKGTTGFGYAVVSTAALATVLDPAAAVVVMILPTLAANLALVRGLGREGLSSCLRRFWPFLAAAVVGTAAGMLFLRRLPTATVALALGAVVLGYVAFKQPWASIPGEQRLRGWCFTPGTAAKVGLGLASGLVFGATNIAVQVVAYLDSLDLDYPTFVGVLAMTLVGIAGLRVAMAFGLGLYGGGSTLLYSVAAVVPGLVGVRAGGRLRSRVPEDVQLAGVVVLLSVIGVRLTLTGLGVA